MTKQVKRVHYIGVMARGIMSLLRIMLVLSLLAQVLFLTLDISKDQIIRPTKLKKELDEFLSKHDLQCEYKKLTASLSGHIEIQDAQLFYKKSSAPFFTCENISLRVKLIPLFFKELSIKSIDIYKGNLLCPPAVSPTGVNEPIIENIHASLFPTDENVNIRSISCKVHNISTVISGNYPLGNSTKSLSFDSSSLLNLSTKLLEAQPFLKNLTNPELVIELHKNETGSLSINASAYAEKFDNLFDVSGKQLKVDFTVNEKAGDFSLDEVVRVSVDNVEYKDQAQAKTTRLVLYFEQLLKFNELPLPHSINARFSGAKYMEHDIEYSNLLVRPQGNSIYKCEIALADKGSWVSGDGIFNLKEQSLKTEINGSIRPEAFFGKIPQVILSKINYIQPKKAVSIQGTMEFAKNFEFQSAKTRINTHEIGFNETTLSNVHLNMVATRENIDVTDAFINSPTTQVEGRFEQDLISHKYRFLLKGHTEPGYLNVWLTQDWWNDLWKKTKIPSNLTDVSIDVQGNWTKDYQNFIFGRILANDLIYRDVPFTVADVAVKYTDTLLSVNIGHADSKKGNLQADLTWKFDPTKNYQLTQTHFDGNSRLSLNELMRFIDSDEVKSNLSDFKCTEPPLLIASGDIFEGNPDKNHYKIQFSTRNPLTYTSIPLDYLRFNTDVNGNNILAKDVNFGFGGGTGFAEAEISKSKNGETNKMHLTLQVRDALCEATINYLSSLGPQSKTKNKKPNKTEGYLDLNIDATGTPGDLSSFMGEGSVSIRQSDLGKVHLLGFLSRILSATPLGFSSFKLTDAASNFSINHENVWFPDISIYGPSVNIKAQGNYTIPNYGLDFIMSIEPVGKQNIPIFSQAIALLSPITQSFQVSVKGTIDNPDWNLKFTPLGLFKKEKSDPN